MKISIRSRGAYQILGIEEDMTVIADLSELKFLVDGYIKQGRCRIAVTFTGTSYIYSGAVAILVECHKQLADDEGELCIIEPNENLRRIFEILNLDQVLPIYDSEDDLPVTH